MREDRDRERGSEIDEGKKLKNSILQRGGHEEMDCRTH